MIPTFDSCRFITIADIKQRIESDTFKYKSVRVVGKIRVLQDQNTGKCIIESDGGEFHVNLYKIKNRQHQVGETYEFFGEIEQKEGQTYLDARVAKPCIVYDARVYDHTTSMITQMIESRILAQAEKVEK